MSGGFEADNRSTQHMSMGPIGQWKDFQKRKKGRFFCADFADVFDFRAVYVAQRCVFFVAGPLGCVGAAFVSLDVACDT